jgi:hypothetical protein
MYDTSSFCQIKYVGIKIIGIYLTFLLAHNVFKYHLTYMWIYLKKQKSLNLSMQSTTHQLNIINQKRYEFFKFVVKKKN